MAFPEHRNSIHISSVEFVQVFVLDFNVVSVHAQEKMAFPEKMALPLCMYACRYAHIYVYKYNRWRKRW